MVHRQVLYKVGITVVAACLGLASAVGQARAEPCLAGACGCVRAVAAIGASNPRKPLAVTYYGVSTLMFSNGEDRLLVDGFFSRPAGWKMLLFPLGPDRGRITTALGKEATPVRAILTAHAHHDHALDTAAVALEAQDAIVVGTPSVARLVGDRKVPSSRICVPDNKPMVFGPYRVTAYSAPHGSSPFYLRWLLDHPLNKNLKGSAWFGSYKDDKNLSFLIEYGDLKIFVSPSAGQMTKPAPAADVVFLGIGRLGNVADLTARAYWDSTVTGKPKAVIPIHWDQFTTAPGEPFRSPPGFLDKSGEGHDRVCAFAGSDLRSRMLRMGSLASLTLTLRGDVQSSQGVTAFCE